LFFANFQEEKVMSNNPDSAKKKLKRNRIAEDQNNYPALFPNQNSPAIITKIPSKEKPSARVFIPARNINCEQRFRHFGIIDWRKINSSDNQKAELKNLENKVICADAKTALQKITDDTIHCIITSPPYWNIVDYGFGGQLGQGSYEEYLTQLLEVWRECERILVPNGKLCIITPIMPISKKVMPEQHTRHIKNINNDIEASILSNLKLKRYSLYIWQKQTTEKMFGSYPYPPNIYEQNTIEFINVLVKDGEPRKLPKEIKEASRLSEKEWMNLTRQIWPLYPEDVKRAKHPAPFPVSLPNRLIAMFTFAHYKGKNVSYEGDIVLDPFCGTGATLIATKSLGRRFIGIDLSPDFCYFSAESLRRTFWTGKIFFNQSRR